VVPGYVETISTDYQARTDYIQLNIQATGGLSGSPVINRSGKVVGVVVESTFERVDDDVPGREFFQALPVRHVVELAGAAT
jgi:S1-C subfamily serine protease